MQETTDDTSGAYDYRKLDKVIHSRIRFAALCFLESAGEASFVDIRDGIRATDGNLSVHLRKLEAAGYVYCDKTYSKRIPLSVYRITDTGRKAFAGYRHRLGDFFTLPLKDIP
ncbi:transcriptional regulator [Prosthecochloris sp. GSB1]|uniref:winged helix-turn-helix domain-containing protein n=1 Tax=Prosthecochloris sp. GSB1 TaxID=281093 RepID=UPI000B8C929B|nr:transcriptional regulator [Prosthecochloris sp. GSB1]ASQ90452.1 transcriptional regulator [Prosthecochloris sp. GSB1]